MMVARRSVGWGLRLTSPSSSRASTSAVTLRRVTPQIVAYAARDLRPVAVQRTQEPHPRVSKTTVLKLRTHPLKRTRPESGELMHESQGIILGH